MSNELLEKFDKLGSQASYHFADDSGAEWVNGYAYQEQAQSLYNNADPETQEDMREIAVTFLWKLKV